jgi:hypothetical protein
LRECCTGRGAYERGDGQGHDPAVQVLLQRSRRAQRASDGAVIHEPVNLSP